MCTIPEFVPLDAVASDSSASSSTVLTPRSASAWATAQPTTPPPTTTASASCAAMPHAMHRGVLIEPFEIERYYERWEFSAELMLSSSDCESRPLGELLALEPDAEGRLHELRLGYTEVPGSPELRDAVAATYERMAPEDVLTLAAAEEGIFIAYHALLAPGDHVIVEAPCYGSALAVARSTGAEVSLWRRRHEQGWAYDLDELEGMLRADTRMLYLNSPHNPTGSQIPRADQARLVEMLAERGTVLFSDEVYRGLEHDESDTAARRLRPLRAGDLAEHGVEVLRAARPAHRLGRLPRRRAARSSARAEALHNDLLLRAQRTARRARAAPLRAADR